MNIAKAISLLFFLVVNLAVWYENDGKGNFTRHVLSRDQMAYDTMITDLDGDGDKDILVAGQRSQNVVWFENPKR